MITQQELDNIDQCGFEAFMFALSNLKINQEFNGKFVIACCSYISTCRCLTNRSHINVAIGKAVDLALYYFSLKKEESLQ